MVLGTACLIVASFAAVEGEVALERTSSGAAVFVTPELPGQTIRQLTRNGRVDQDAAVRLFAVYPGEDPDRRLPPMLGTYELADRRLTFVPRFPLRPGTTYTACRVDGDEEELTTFRLPPPDAARVHITSIYPSAEELPENTLKFYFHFSGPMSRGQAYRRVHLVRDDGEIIQYPFLELEQELWNGDGTRFTLFFDPGRIKRGLRPREEVGPALEEGRTYELRVDAEWLDALGRPMSRGFRKTFRVGPPDDGQPDPDNWRLEPPEAGTREPLVVVFDEALDHAMLQRVLVVLNENDVVLDGTTAVSDEETRWTWTPSAPWASTPHRISVATTLEDRAGNSIGRPFEVDVFREVERSTEVPRIAIPFLPEASGDGNGES